MKIKIFAVCILVFTILAVTANTLIIKKQIEDTKLKILSLDPSDKSALEEARKTEAQFRRRITYISLTVTHDDLTVIEQAFAELVAYLEIGDADGAHVTKNRLLDSLEHLGRLSGFNIDAII